MPFAEGPCQSLDDLYNGFTRSFHSIMNNSNARNGFFVYSILHRQDTNAEWEDRN